MQSSAVTMSVMNGELMRKLNELNFIERNLGHNTHTQKQLSSSLRR